MTTRRREKRPNGDGSVYPKGSGFEVALMVNGRRVTRRCRTRQEGKALLRDLQALRQAGRVPLDAKTTVEQFLTRWLELRRTGGSIRFTTWRRYEEFVRVHAVPEIGRTRLIALRPLDLQDLYARRLAAGSSPQTVLHLHRVLHKAFEDAVGWEVLGRNPARFAMPPAVTPVPVDAYSPSEVATLIAAVGQHRYGALYILAVTTGLRQGEMLALRWEDLDLDGEYPAATIRGSMQRTANGRQVGETKTVKSKRTVEIIGPAKDALLAHRRHQVQQRLAVGEWPDHDLVFTGNSGAPLRPDTVRTSWRAFCASAGLRYIRFKNLRHTFATIHLDTGVPDKIVSEALGHSRTAITNDLYRRVERRQQRWAADRFAAVVAAEDQALGALAQDTGSQPTT